MNTTDKARAVHCYTACLAWVADTGDCHFCDYSDTGRHDDSCPMVVQVEPLASGALTRILELLGTADKLHIELTKFGPRAFFIRINDMDDVNATGTAMTLEATAEAAVASALHVGLMCEPMPRTEPNPEGVGR